VAVECVEQRDGLHVNEDHFVVEVIDPQDGHVLEPGAEGELVFTTLTKEALPLIRYRTSDIGRLTTEACPCGRTTARLLGLRGRLDDMVVIRGVNVYPSQVEHLLLGVEGIAPHYRLIVARPGMLDELALECEAAGGTGEADREALAERIVARLREHMGLRIGVRVLAPGALPRSDGKAIRLVDRRPAA
jgi:phenylacetate-CoA ligase